MFKFILIVVFFIFSTTIYAQRPAGGGQGMGNPNAPSIGIVSGKVIDGISKVPMQYVSVAIYSLRDSSIFGGAITNDSGKFVINEVKFGRYFLVATFMGYKRDTVRDIRVMPNNYVINIPLIKMGTTSKDLSEVEIVATKTYVEYKIDRKVVNVGTDISASGGSAVQALENVPSVTVDIDGNVSLRGSTNFTVLIDGKPSPLTGTQALEQIPVGAVQNIEIITNPSAKYDPDGMSGIVNIIMKKNVISGINGMVEVSYGTYNNASTNALFSYRTKKFNVFAGADYSNRNNPGRGEGTLEQYKGDTTFFRINESQRQRMRDGFGFKTGFDYFFNDKNTVSMEGRFNVGNHSDPFEGRTHEYFSPVNINYDIYKYTESDGNEASKNFSGNMTWERKFGTGNEKLITIMDFKKGTSSSSDWQKDYISDNEYNPSSKIYSANETTESENNQNFLFKMDYTKPLKMKKDTALIQNGDHKFEAGFQARLSTNNQDYLFYNLDTNSNSLKYNDLYSSEMVFIQNIFSGYATYGGIWKESYGYLFGLRGEYTYRSIESKAPNRKIDRLDYFPTVHFSKKFKKDQQVLLSYSRRIERPGGWNLDPFPRYMSTNFIRIGNPELLPEYYNNFELSFQMPIKTSSFSIEAYYRSTQNKITQIRTVDSANSYMRFTNLDRDFATGFEGSLNMNISKTIMWNVSGSIFYYELFGNVESADVNKSSTNYNFKSNATWRFSQNGKLQLNGFYEGPSVSAQGTTKSMATASASIRYDFFKKKLGVTLSVRDIFNSSRHSFISYGENFYSTNEYVRMGRMLNVSLQYKINNYKQDTRRQSNGNGMGGDEGGGEF